jgi:Na+-transporting methylmalonyl-CoA/oxaloacetate decarboxylase gamma subunit
MGQGIIITIGGMGLVFLSLAIILLVIVALNKLFSPKGANSGSLSVVEAEDAPEGLGPNPYHDLTPETNDELVAAISTALAILTEEVKLEKEWKARVVARTNGASLWKAAMWPQLLDTRGLKGRQW